MATVAEWLALGFFATAEENRFGLFGFVGQRGKIGPVVTAVAKRLRGAETATAPSIDLAFFDLDAIRRILSHDSFIHEFSFFAG